MLRALGTDVKVQQELLRHADVRTTLNIYTQAVMEQKREAIERVAELVLPKKQQAQEESGPSPVLSSSASEATLIAP